jgi:TP901 family phage tail tape measure protein
MAETIAIPFQVDAQIDSALRAIDNLVTKAQTGLRALSQGTKINIDSGAAQKAITSLADGFTDVKTELNSTISTQKQALAALAAAGQAGTKEFQSLLGEVKKNQTELAKLDEAAEQVEKSLGNVNKGSSIGEKFAKFGLAANGIQQVASAFDEVIKVGAEFDDTLKAVGAVTGASAEVLTDLGNRGRNLALTFGGSASDQLKSFQGILSKFGAQVADSPAALSKMAESVNILAKAGGIDAAQAMDALTDTMLQMGLVTGDANKDAENSVRVIDALASSAQIGAAEIPDVAASMLQVGVAAKGANLSVEATAGALQVLAVGGKKGSEAGIALRNVLGLIQKASGPAEETMKKFGTSSKELGEILTTQGLGAALNKIKGGMDKLGSAAERNAALMTIFGTENSAAAGILLENTDKIKEFTAGIEDAVKLGANGAAGAVQQANINMQSAGAVISRIKARVEDTFVGLTQAVGSSVTGAIGAINQLAPTLTGLAGITQLVPEGAFEKVVGKAKEFGGKASQAFGTAFEKLPLDGVKSKLGDALSKIPIDTGKLASAFSDVGAKASAGLSKAFSGLGAVAFNPITLGVVAAGAALTLFFTQTEAGKKSFEQIKKVALEAFGTLTKALEPLGKVLGELFGSIATSGGGLLTALTPLLEFLGKALAKQAEILGVVLVAVFTGAARAVTFVSAGISAVITGFQSFFAAISPVTTQIGLLVGEVGRFIAAFYTGAFNNIVGIFSAIGGAISSIGAAFGKFVSEAIKPVTDGFSAIGSAIGGFITSLFGTSEATKQVSSNTAAIGTAATTAAKSVSTFQSVIQFLTSSITNVRAALAGISAVLSTVGAAFSQFLEGVKTLDLGKITSAFTDLGGKVQASFTGKWNETWNEANKTTEKATEKIKADVDTKTKEAAAKAQENLSKPIELKLDIKKLAEDFSALQSNLQGIAETGIKGLTQNTLQVAETKEKVAALNKQLASESNAANKAALQAQLNDQKSQLAQRAVFESEERKKAQQASKEAFKNETALTNEKNRTDRASILKTEKDRRNVALGVLAQELEAARILEADDRKRRVAELEDKTRIEREKLKLEQKFGDQSAAAQANVKKQLLEKDKQYLNEKRKLELDFLKEDVENAKKLAEERAKSSVAALQAQIQKLSFQDVSTLEKRGAASQKLIEEQNALETRAYLDALPAFQKVLNAKQAALVRATGANKQAVTKELEKLRSDVVATLSDESLSESEIVQKVKVQLNTDEESAALVLQNFRLLQEKQASEEIKKRRDIDDKIETARIQSSLNVGQREFDLRKQQIERQLQSELALAGSNATLIAEAQAKANIANVEALGKLRESEAASVAEREAQSRLNELNKAYASETALFLENEKQKNVIAEQAAQVRAALASGSVSPQDKPRFSAVLEGLDAELATFRQNEQLKLDIENEFAQKRIALLQQQMIQRSGVVRFGVSAEKQIYESLFAGLSVITNRFNASRADYEDQKADLARSREEELRVSRATGKERLEILKKYRNQERELDRKFTGGAAALQELKIAGGEVLGNFAATSQAAFAKATASAKGFSDIGTEAFANLGAAAISTFAQVVVSGGDVGKALAKVAFDTLQSLVPILVAQITATSLAQPDSVATFGATGAARAALLTALLQGAISVARAALGFRKGGYTGDGAPDREAGIVHKGEFVHTYETTKQHRELFEHLHTGKTLDDYVQNVLIPRKPTLAERGLQMASNSRAKQSVLQNIVQVQMQNGEIVRAIEKQTSAFEQRLVGVEDAMRYAGREFKSKQAIQLEVVPNNERYIQDIQKRSARAALG